MIPNVFISSTIEDLHHVRDAVRETISELGYQPIMSEHGGVGYMNDTAADVACYQSVQKCQLMILIIGKRYGSKTQGSSSVSVTEREYDTCMEHAPRLISFVDAEVMNYKRVFDESPNAEKVNYPGMDNATATFAFINKIMHASVRNAILPFSSVSDVRAQLKLQLASLFYDLLEEHANPAKSALDEIMVEVKTIRNALTEQAKPDMRFLTVFKFLLDDGNQYFRQFLKAADEDVENIIPKIYDASSFDDFVQQARISIEATGEENCFMAFKDRRNLIHASSFVPIQFMIGAKDQTLLKCSYAVDSEGSVIMNNAAHDYFSRVYSDLKKRLSRLPENKMPQNPSANSSNP